MSEMKREDHEWFQIKKSETVDTCEICTHNYISQPHKTGL